MTAYDPKRAAEYHDEIHARVPSEAALTLTELWNWLQPFKEQEQLFELEQANNASS